MKLSDVVFEFYFSGRGFSESFLEVVDFFFQFNYLGLFLNEDDCVVHESCSSKFIS